MDADDPPPVAYFPGMEWVPGMYDPATGKKMVPPRKFMVPKKPRNLRCEECRLRADRCMSCKHADNPSITICDKCSGKTYQCTACKTTDGKAKQSTRKIISKPGLSRQKGPRCARCTGKMSRCVECLRRDGLIAPKQLSAYEKRWA